MGKALARVAETPADRGCLTGRLTLVVLRGPDTSRGAISVDEYGSGDANPSCSTA